MPAPLENHLPAILDTQTAHQLGFSRHAIAHRISTRRWRRLARGVYLTHNGMPSVEQWAAGAVHACGPGAVLAGILALRLHGLRTTLPPRPLVVLAPRTARRTSSGQLIVRHTTRLTAPRIRAGLPLAPVPRCVVEAALAITNLNDTRELVAATVQQRLCGIPDITDELAQSQRRGSANIRRVLGEVADGAESVAECEVAELLYRAGISGFEQNVDIRDSTGRFLGRGDFVWRDLRCVLEIDGQDWHLDPESWQNTLRRHNRLEAAGYAVLHLTPAQFRRDPAGCIALVRRWLADRARLLAA